MKKPEQPDPLQPVLQDAEAELSRRLHEACEAEAGGLSSKTSKEIREIEDSLLAAAVAAGQTIALRRHIKKREEAEREKQSEEKPPEGKEAAERDPTVATVEGGSEESVSTVREFRDSAGQKWRAWPVIPGLSRTGRPTQYLGEFQRGWICFESLDSSARRRLPCAPARLAETKDEELERLLREAIMAPERKGSRKPSMEQ